MTGSWTVSSETGFTGVPETVVDIGETGTLEIVWTPRRILRGPSEPDTLGSICTCGEGVQTVSKNSGVWSLGLGEGLRTMSRCWESGVFVIEDTRDNDVFRDCVDFH